MYQKWVEALRSGKYKQGKYKLRNEEDEYCCLGVLCDISTLGKWLPLDEEENCYPYVDSICSYIEVLPSVIAAEYHIPPEIERKLTQMNDAFDYSFNRIADWIEENLS